MQYGIHIADADNNGSMQFAFGTNRQAAISAGLQLSQMLKIPNAVYVGNDDGSIASFIAYGDTITMSVRRGDNWHEVESLDELFFSEWNGIHSQAIDGL